MDSREGRAGTLVYGWRVQVLRWMPAQYSNNQANVSRRPLLAEAHRAHDGGRRIHCVPRIDPTVPVRCEGDAKGGLFTDTWWTARGAGRCAR